MATVASDLVKPTKYGGKYTVTLIPGKSPRLSCCLGAPLIVVSFTLGDGIGAEVTESVKEIFKRESVPVEWEQVDVTGVVTGNSHPEDLFRKSVRSLKRNKVGLKGGNFYDF